MRAFIFFYQFLWNLPLGVPFGAQNNWSQIVRQINPSDSAQPCAIHLNRGRGGFLPTACPKELLLELRIGELDAHFDGLLRV